MVGNIGLLTAEVARKVLVFNWLRSEPEMLLLENEAPVEWNVSFHS